MVGGAGGWSWTGTDPKGRRAPCGRTPQQVDERSIVGVADDEQHVTRSDVGTRHGRQALPRQRHGRQRRLPDDHRMDEFDGHVLCVVRPRRRPAPERGARVQPASQDEGSRGKVFRQPVGQAVRAASGRRRHHHGLAAATGAVLSARPSISAE